MKKQHLFLLLPTLLLSAFITSCKDNESGAQKYSFWQGAIANKYYFLDLCGGQTGQVSGKPYMILEYDPATGKPIRCEFGLSEATYTALARENPTICLASPPEPMLAASSFTYAKRLSLSGSVDLLSNWGTVTLYSDLSGGGFEFTVGNLHFEKTNEGMTGEIIDSGQTGWGDAVSAANAFNMLHKFNSTTIDN